MIFDFLALLSTIQVATAQPSQPSAMLLAQAHDRCLATVASQQLGQLDDEKIYANAIATCSKIEVDLYKDIRIEYPIEQAEYVIGAIKAKSRSNFTNVLRKMEAQRGRRNAELGAMGLETGQTGAEND